MLQVNGNTLQQVEKLKYLGVVFTSVGRRIKELHKRIGKEIDIIHERRKQIQKRSSAWALSLCDDKTGGFKHRKPINF